jgi:hypothetical protein
VSYFTAREEFSITKRKAERLITELVKLELVRKSEFQPGKNIVRYETTIQGNALALAKAGNPVSRASADRVLQEFLDRVKRVNEQSELAYNVESVVVFGSYLTDRTKLNDLDKAGVKNGLADSRHSSFSSSSLRVANGIVAFPRQVFASLSPLWLSIKSQRKGSTFLPFLEHALSDISKGRLLFNVGADFGRGV